jgi:hypothetical protein
MIILEDRILLHLQDGKRIPVDPQEIYLLEAEGGETLVRTRHLYSNGWHLYTKIKAPILKPILIFAQMRYHYFVNFLS